MAVANRGLRKTLGGFYDQFEIEIIQRETATWYRDSPLFSEWISALDAADTGERSGLSQSTWGPDVGDAHAAEEDVSVDPFGEGESVDNHVPLPRLTHSAKQYADMMNSGMPEMPVHTGVERRKFASELADNLYRPGDDSGRLQQYQRINFDKWAVEWNSYCSKIESGKVAWEAVYRKTSRQLEGYYEEFKQRANATLTMLPIRKEHQQLRSVLQQVVSGGVFDDLVGEVVPTPAPRTLSDSAVAGSEEDAYVDIGGNGEGGSAGGAGVMPDSVHAGAGGVAAPEKKKSAKNRPQTCDECGHHKQDGAFKGMHKHPRTGGDGKPTCEVPVEKRRSDKYRTERRYHRGGRHRFSLCEDQCCKPLQS